MVTVLGIDPGYALVGWSFLQFDHKKIKVLDYGVITTDKEMSSGYRLGEIYKDMIELLKEFRPDYAGLEKLLFSRNTTTAMAVSEARGVIMLALEQNSIPMYEVTPLQVKSGVTGYGKATKKQVQESVRILCGLESIPKPDDAADAIAVGICTYSIASKNSRNLIKSKK